jgi:hypothetical protein
MWKRTLTLIVALGGALVVAIGAGAVAPSKVSATATACTGGEFTGTFTWSNYGGGRVSSIYTQIYDEYATPIPATVDSKSTPGASSGTVTMTWTATAGHRYWFGGYLLDKKDLVISNSAAQTADIIC